MLNDVFICVLMYKPLTQTQQRVQVTGLPFWDLSCMLKTLDTIGNCQRLVFKVGVSQHLHKINNKPVKLISVGRQSCKILMKEKNITLVAPWSHEVVCFPMLDFETSDSKSEVSKSNSWKLTSFSKTASELFLTMCYTINLSRPITGNQERCYANNCFG